MKNLIFNSLYPIWGKKLLPKIQISMCREVIFYMKLHIILRWGDPHSDSHQGISHVDPLAPGTAWEASWCSVGTTAPLFSSSECNWTARGLILQPPDSQYWNINSWLKTLERTLSRGFNWRKPPSRPLNSHYLVVWHTVSHAISVQGFQFESIISMESHYQLMFSW